MSMNLFFSPFVIVINHIGLISANVSVILYWCPYSNAAIVCHCKSE